MVTLVTGLDFLNQQPSEEDGGLRALPVLICPRLLLATMQLLGGKQKAVKFILEVDVPQTKSACLMLVI